MFPAESIVMPNGCAPVVPKMVDTPAGVIFVTVFASWFAV